MLYDHSPLPQDLHFPLNDAPSRAEGIEVADTIHGALASLRARARLKCSSQQSVLKGVIEEAEFEDFIFITRPSSSARGRYLTSWT